MLAPITGGRTMKPEDVLMHPALVLTEAQRTAYFADRFLVLPNYVPQVWLARLRAATQEMLERSCSVAQSDDVFVLEEGHGPDTPRLHRVTSPQDQHPTFWDFMCDPVMTDLAADVVGPDVKFHHAKLNVKSERGTRGFKWHQDIPRLASHRLQPGDDRRLHQRLRRRHGAAVLRARQPTWAVAQSI